MFIFFKTAKNNLIKISILIIPLLTAVGINTTLIEDNTVNVAKRTINISTQSTNDRQGIILKPLKLFKKALLWELDLVIGKFIQLRKTENIEIILCLIMFIMTFYKLLLKSDYLVFSFIY